MPLSYIEIKLYYGNSLFKIQKKKCFGKNTSSVVNLNCIWNNIILHLCSRIGLGLKYYLLEKEGQKPLD